MSGWFLQKNNSHILPEFVVKAFKQDYFKQ